MSGPGVDRELLHPPAPAERTRARDQTLVRTEPLGGGPLTRAALAGTTPSGWYPPRPRSPREWRERVTAVLAQARDGRWLEELWPAIEPTGPARERLERAAKHGVVVTSGQQPGLFGGPIYTWSKAIAVLALADALERICGIPVAPLFWAATDDADFAEASTTWIAVPGGVESITAEPIAAAGTVLAAAPLGDLSVPVGRLIGAAGSASFGIAIDALRKAYAGMPGAGSAHDGRPPHSDVTAGSAFVALLRQLLSPLGVSVMDASHDAVRRRAFPTLVNALRQAGPIERALDERTRAITAAGCAAQVSNVPGLSLVFSWHTPQDRGDGAGPPTGPTKVRVPVAQAGDLAAKAAPGELSHNVLLRPIVERALVPSVAYLGGPSEIAYFAQTSAVADVLQVPQPLILPRWSCTLIEPSAAALLTRFDTTLEELHDLHGPETRLARATLPAAVREALDALSDAIESGSRRLAAADTGELVPRAAIDGARTRLAFRVGRLERRYVAAAKRAEQGLLRDLATLRGALYPTGVRQERVLNFIPFLARGGTALLEAMRVEATRHAADLTGGDPSRLP
jgi:bacillithiol synthase